MSRPVNIGSIPERMKVLKCWSVWKTEETESGSKQKVSYCTYKRHVDTSKPETWLSFGEAVVLLARYPEFEGLSFIRSKDLGITLGWQNTVTEAVTQVYYKIGNLRTFLNYKCPFSRGLPVMATFLTQVLGRKGDSKGFTRYRLQGASQKSPSIKIEQTSKRSKKDAHYNIKLTKPPKVLPQYSRCPPTKIDLKNSIGRSERGRKILDILPF